MTQRMRKAAIVAAATAIAATFWVGRAMGTDTGGAGEPEPSACLATQLPPTWMPMLSTTAQVGLLKFAEGVEGNAPPLAINTRVQPLSQQQVPTFLWQKAQSTTNPDVPLQFRFVNINFEGIGLDLANTNHNNVLSLTLFSNVTVQVATVRFRQAEFASGYVFYWWGRLLNNQGGAPQNIKASYYGARFKLTLTQNGKDYHILSMPSHPGLFLFMEFEHQVEPDSTCGT